MAQEGWALPEMTLTCPPWLLLGASATISVSNDGRDSVPPANQSCPWTEPCYLDEHSPPITCLLGPPPSTEYLCFPS